MLFSIPNIECIYKIDNNMKKIRLFVVLLLSIMTISSEASLLLSRCTNNSNISSHHHHPRHKSSLFHHPSNYSNSNNKFVMSDAIQAMRKRIIGSKKRRMNAALVIFLSSLMGPSKSVFAASVGVVESTSISTLRASSVKKRLGSASASASMKGDDSLTLREKKENQLLSKINVSDKAIAPSIPVVVAAAAGYNFLWKKKRDKSNVEFDDIEEIEVERITFEKNLDGMIQSMAAVELSGININVDNQGDASERVNTYCSDLNLNSAVEGSNNDEIPVKMIQTKEKILEADAEVRDLDNGDSSASLLVGDNVLETDDEAGRNVLSASSFFEEPEILSNGLITVEDKEQNDNNVSSYDAIDDNGNEKIISDQTNFSPNNDTSPISLLLDYGGMQDNKEQPWFERVLSSPGGDPAHDVLDEGAFLRYSKERYN